MKRPKYHSPSEPISTFAFFPYLKTSRPVPYRGLTFRSTEDESDLPPAVVAHLQILRKRFFLHDNLRIQRFIYTYAHIPSIGGDAEQFLRKVREFQILLTYMYATPSGIEHKPFLSSESGTMYVVRPQDISRYLVEHEHNVEVTACPALQLPEGEEYVEGYECILNNRSYFWATPESQIYPPTVRIILNISQDVGVDLLRVEGRQQHPTLLGQYLDRSQLSKVDERVLTALQWYNRSTSAESDDEVQLINLAIAFESLLGLEQGERVTSRFKEAIVLLLGPIPRLDSWLSQFYKARSEIVHEGRTQALMFVPVDDPMTKKPTKAETTRYRSLISYGRTVFRICATTILTGSRLAEQLDVADLFRTNTERLNEICRILRNSTDDPANGLSAAEEHIRAIDRYRYVSDDGLTVDRLIGTLKLVAGVYLATSPSEEPIVPVLNEMSQTKTTGHLKFLRLVKTLHALLKAPTESGADETNRRLVQILTNTVWHYTFMYYFQLEDQEGSSESEADGEN